MRPTIAYGRQRAFGSRKRYWPNTVIGSDFTEEVGNAATFGLSNVTAPACAQVGVTAFGDPTPCTNTALDANPPAGLAPGWWTTWAFSDGFHPTPFGHQLLASSVNRALARAGWL